jgi:hypothetical protein
LIRRTRLATARKQVHPGQHVQVEQHHAYHALGGKQRQALDIAQHQPHPHQDQRDWQNERSPARNFGDKPDPPAYCWGMF